jgi:hypothetical protein
MEKKKSQADMQTDKETNRLTEKEIDIQTDRKRKSVREKQLNMKS